MLGLVEYLDVVEFGVMYLRLDRSEPDLHVRGQLVKSSVNPLSQQLPFHVILRMVFGPSESRVLEQVSWFHYCLRLRHVPTVLTWRAPPLSISVNHLARLRFQRQFRRAQL